MRTVNTVSRRFFLLQMLQLPRLNVEKKCIYITDRFLSGNRFELFILINTVRAPGI